MGYAVEWKVVNAADYGMPQKRRRIFILGYHKSTKIYKKMLKEKEKWLYKSGVLIKAFKSEASQMDIFPESLKSLEKPIQNSNRSPFKTGF